METIIQSLRIYLVLTLLTGVIYPIAMAGFGQLAFPRQASGSRLTSKGKLIGSELLAQKFEGAEYFWPRPSSADFATVPSGASNKGPTSADLKKSISERRAKFGANAAIDLLTARGADSIRTSRPKRRVSRLRALRRREVCRQRKFRALSITRSSLRSSDSSASRASTSCSSTCSSIKAVEMKLHLVLAAFVALAGLARAGEGPFPPLRQRRHHRNRA